MVRVRAFDQWNNPALDGQVGIETSLGQLLQLNDKSPAQSLTKSTALTNSPERQNANSAQLVVQFGVEGDFDPATLRSNTFELEWPPKSGRRATFPEVDRAAWFSLEMARAKILSGQREFITRLVEMA